MILMVLNSGGLGNALLKLAKIVGKQLYTVKNPKVKEMHYFGKEKGYRKNSNGF